MTPTEIVKHRFRLERAARFAKGAYNASGQHAWHYGSARGAVIWEAAEGILILAIAGTDDADDMILNTAVSPRSLDDWGFAAGIQIARDSQQVRSTVGFLDYAANCYEGISAKMTELGLSLDKAQRVVLAGHSLGGAACFLLQHTKMFEEAEAIVFGAPRAFKRNQQIPSRIRYSVWDPTDLVPYVPLSCKHPRCVQFIVTGKGRVPQTHYSRQQWVPVALRCVVSWGVGAAIALGNLAGRRVDFSSLFAGHSMSKYKEMLTVL